MSQKKPIDKCFDHTEENLVVGSIQKGKNEKFVKLISYLWRAIGVYVMQWINENVPILGMAKGSKYHVNC